MAILAEKKQRKSSVLPLAAWAGYDKIPPQLPLEEAYFGAARIVNALIDFSGELRHGFRTAGLLPVQWAESLLGRAIQAMRLNYNALLGVMMCTVDAGGRQAHGVHTALLSMLAGCQWGLPAKDVCDLGLAGLLCDWGSTAFIGHAAARPGPEAGEAGVERAHLPTGGTCRERALDPGLTRAAEAGQGCRSRAAGCAGEKIALAARIHAIARNYAALLRPGPGRNPLPPHQALAWMQARGSDFDGAMLGHFIRCLGMYPVGGVVETHCGQRGLVIENNPDMPQLFTVRLLRPLSERAAFGPETTRSWQAEQIARACPLIAPA